MKYKQYAYETPSGKTCHVDLNKHEVEYMNKKKDILNLREMEWQ